MIIEVERILEGYRTLIFDCDGVILNSNQIKTEAFFQCALQFGHKEATLFRDYHIRNGGISRYKKFEYFFRVILNRNHIPKEELAKLLDQYATIVRKGLLTCGVAHGLSELRSLSAETRWLIVSGSDQSELRDIFNARALSHLFDGGIFGSPEDKISILSRELGSGNIMLPALFFGDSKYDAEAAQKSGVDFIFVSDWSELGKADSVAFRRIPNLGYISTLLNRA